MKLSIFHIANWAQNLQINDTMALKRHELADFLFFLSRLEAEYCILHPFEERGFLSQTDLDIYVESGKYRDVHTFLLQNRWSEDPTFRFCDRRKFFSKIIRGFKLKLDISLSPAVYAKSTCFVYTRPVGKKTGRDGFLYLDDFSGFCFMLKKAMITGYIPENKRMDLNCLIGRCEDLSKLPLVPASGWREACRAHADFLEGLFTPDRRGRINPARWIRAYAGRLCLSRGRVTVSLVGLDGAGKGTYIELLKVELAARNIVFKTVYLGYSAYRMPVLRSLVRLKGRSRSALFRKIFMGAYLLLLPIEFLVRRGNGAYDVLLTDRHPMYEPVFHGEASNIYDRIISAICPHPSLVLYLSGDARELWKRKQETGLEQYIRRRERLDGLVRKHSEYVETVEIDTVGHIPEVFDKLRAAIEKYV